MSKPSEKPLPAVTDRHYVGLVTNLGRLLEVARHSSARAVNAVMTATYWDLGRQIVEFEQGGEKRAGYGEELLLRLATDLSRRFGRGFSYPNLNKFRQFYLAYQTAGNLSTPSRDSVAPIHDCPE